MTVDIDPTILSQIKEIQALGYVNMFDTSSVIQLLQSKRYTKAIRWIRKDKGRYFQLLTEGPTPRQDGSS